MVLKRFKPFGAEVLAYLEKALAPNDRAMYKSMIKGNALM